VNGYKAFTFLYDKGRSSRLSKSARGSSGLSLFFYCGKKHSYSVSKIGKREYLLIGKIHKCQVGAPNKHSWTK